MRLFGKHKTLALETIFVTVSNLVVALLVNLLAWRVQLVSGGLTGYSLFINLLTGLPTGTVLLVLNIILLLLALVLVGKGPGARGVYGFASLSAFLDLTRQLLNLKQVATPSFGTSLVLITLLSITMGTAVCVVLANNYSIGAYSTIYIIAKKFIEIKAQNLFFGLDFALAILVGLVYGLEKGILLVVNAIVAYWVVRLLLPKFETLFAKLRS